jgi:hypothetical protein
LKLEEIRIQSPVKIKKGKKSFKVYFTYNPDLVDIMKDHDGWYFKKQKAWTFPNKRFRKVYDDLKEEGYKVNISTEVPKPKNINVDKKKELKNKDVIAVFGTCKKCKQKNFVGEDDLCSRCRNTVKK